MAKKIEAPMLNLGAKAPAGTMEDFKRPDHPDFMTSSELKAKQWSGIRHNSITDTAEIWILGNLEETITATQVQLNPLAINEAFERLFALAEVMPDTDLAKAYIAERNRNERS